MNELQTELAAQLRPGLVPERISQLPADFGGNRLILVHTIIVGQDAFRHAEGTEQEVPDRESSCKVGVAALVLSGVVPAMKDRRRDDVFERSEGPVEIGVDERRVERRE